MTDTNQIYATTSTYVTLCYWPFIFLQNRNELIEFHALKKVPLLLHKGVGYTVRKLSLQTSLMISLFSVYRSQGPQASGLWLLSLGHPDSGRTGKTYCNNVRPSEMIDASVVHRNAHTQTNKHTHKTHMLFSWQASIVDSYISLAQTQHRVII